jgi:PIN domain nuclease of toxin-antitoxin system
MLEDSPRLSTNARHAIKQAVEEGPIYIAGISLLEVARLMAANRIETSASLDALLA